MSVTSPMAATIDVATLNFAALTVTAKGGKQLPALYIDGSPVAFQPEALLEVPFEPSAFNDPEATRVTLCLIPTEDLCETIKELDAWVLESLIANPTNLLGLTLSAEQIRERYVSSIKVSEKGYKTLRAKMNKAGRYALQCYTPDKEKRPHPVPWRGCSVQARLVFKGLYVMGREFGSIIEATHALVYDDAGDACPF